MWLQQTQSVCKNVHDNVAVNNEMARAALHLGSDLHKEAQGFQHACPHSLRGLPVTQVHPLQLLRQLLRSAPAHSAPSAD